MFHRTIYIRRANSHSVKMLTVVCIPKNSIEYSKNACFLDINGTRALEQFLVFILTRCYFDVKTLKRVFAYTKRLRGNALVLALALCSFSLNPHSGKCSSHTSLS